MKNLKSIIFSSILSLQFLSSGLIYADSDEYDKNRPLEYTQELNVNRDNEVRLYSVKNRVDGIKDLVKQADRSIFEESWAFIPSKSVWYETGYDEFCELEIDKNGNPKNKQEVKIDVPFLKVIAKTNNVMELYHFHPSGIGMINAFARIKQGKETKTDLTFWDYKKNIGKFYKLLECNSDLADINNMIFINKELKEINSNISVKTYSVSISGVTEYSLTDKGLSLLDTKTNSTANVKSPYMYPNVINPKKERDQAIEYELYNMRFKFKNEENPELTRTFSSEFYKGNFKITFTPLQMLK